MNSDEAGPPQASRLRAALSLATLVVPPLLAALALGAWLAYVRIDALLVEKFAGRRWDFPSKVYSAAYELYPGAWIGADSLTRRLTRLGYHQVGETPPRRGEFFDDSAVRRVEVWLRSFTYPGRRQPSRNVAISYDGNGFVTAIVDREGETPLTNIRIEPLLVAGLHGALREERREMLLQEVPAPLVASVLAVEDRRFFEHVGVDLRGLTRAFVVNVAAGQVRQGGSTLTQQLMKNFFLTEERTLLRKLREAAMALVAERRFAKREILENYLNEIYMGQKGGIGVHGMWEASKHYFGREPRELTLGQTATLAGVIRAPNYYSPHNHPERALARRDTVLRLLLEQGDIDRRTYKLARGEELLSVPPSVSSNRAPYFTDFVREELLANYPADVLSSEGFSIFTTIDPELQSLAERVVVAGLERIEASHVGPQSPSRAARLEGALLAINPRTGEIVAMVGGRDYSESQYNRAIHSRRQPGSVFKPIVMLAALSNYDSATPHYVPTTAVLDSQFTWEYDESSWTPANYADKYYGKVTLRKALELSLNSATARIARDIGIDKVREMSVRLGMDASIPSYPAIALGGWEASMLELARVYGVFANNGFAATPLSVVKVTDRYGHDVEGRRVKIKRVLPAEQAFLVTHLLQGVMERGTGKLARAFGFRHPAAGKTGTTNGYNDAWFAGYTPELLTIVWVGYDRDVQLGLTGARAALPIWTEFMREALRGHPPVPFRVPEGAKVVDVDVRTGLKARPECGDFVSVAFLDGEQPREYCTKAESGIFFLH